MKKIILSIATVMITAGAYAQTDSTYRTGNQSENMYNSNSKHQNQSDGFMFKNGKILTVENGKATPLEKDTTLTNGTVIMSNGQYMEEGGSQMQFKEGEHMDLAGNMTDGNSSRNNKSGMNSYGMNNSEYKQDKDSKNYSDGYLFQNGKVLQVRDGKMTPIEQDVTLRNGTVIMSNGTYKKRGESSMKFKQGEHIDMSGKLVQNNLTSDTEEPKE